MRRRRTIFFSACRLVLCERFYKKNFHAPHFRCAPAHSDHDDLPTLDFFFITGRSFWFEWRWVRLGQAHNLTKVLEGAHMFKVCAPPKTCFLGTFLTLAAIFSKMALWNLTTPSGQSTNMVPSWNLEVSKNVVPCDDGCGTYHSVTFFSENRSSIRITRKRVKGPFFGKYSNRKCSKI